MTSIGNNIPAFIASFPTNNLNFLTSYHGIRIKSLPNRCTSLRPRVHPYAQQDLGKSTETVRRKAYTSSNRTPRLNLNDQQVWSAGERPPLPNIYPPGKFPFAVELDFFLNHPITDIIIAFLVILNCLAFALQTIDVAPELYRAFQGYEQNVSILFLLEYFGRWYGKGLSPRFLLTRGMLIDFFAVAPIGFAFVDQSEALFVRMLRLTRILRLQRVVMGTDGGKEMMTGLSELQIRIANVALSLFSLLYVSAGLFFQAEREINPGVHNFFDAFYFTTITLFTVGFGDVTPLTSQGRIITVLTVLTGAFIIPFKLSEVERLREINEKSKPNKTRLLEGNGDLNDGDIVTLKAKVSEDSLVDIECKRCHLRVHQVDARFCRNCGTLLRKRLYD